MYRHEDAGDHISLHDCQAHSIAIENGLLILRFPAGIRVLPTHPENETGEIRMSDAAEARFPLRYPDDWHSTMDIYAYSREDDHGRCTRKRWTPQKLLRKVCDDYRMEIVTLYASAYGVLLKGFFWFDEKPYSKAYELELMCGEPTFCWSELTDEAVN